ncbi:hypothetical protein [Clostridium grantii]|uniref:Uncharacterized protein n=1 Tax=Clostridium grantii DSM 8605 TaxID=1121316 RepID=A0A1M5SDA9_9CLOT|nr:hypothetical protein [Clostridium grantii]SHH36430.1 hypothetical protein SAMN02745207_00875 [Clostridium grantii DSM 8605]
MEIYEKYNKIFKLIGDFIDEKHQGISLENKIKSLKSELEEMTMDNSLKGTEHRRNLDFKIKENTKQLREYELLLQIREEINNID